MNSSERMTKVETQSRYAEQCLQKGLVREDAQPRLRIAEDVLIEGLSSAQYNEYIRARAALAREFARKLN